MPPPTGDSINSLDDLGERWKQQIEHRFNHYKNPQDSPDRTVLNKDLMV